MRVINKILQAFPSFHNVGDNLMQHSLHVLRKLLPLKKSEDDEFVRLVRLARELQELGYDIGFTFIPRFPDAPHMVTCAARLGKETFVGIGSDARSKTLAFKKALFEVMERALWRESPYWQEESIRTSLRALERPHVDISMMSGFSREQRENSKELFFDADTKFLWSKGTRLSDNTDCFVPTQLMSARYDYLASGEPMLRMGTSNGLAAGETHEDACYRALLELIERDAFMITFWNSMKPYRIDYDSLSRKTRDIIDDLGRYKLSCEVMLLKTDMPIHVVSVVIRDPTGVGPALSLGAKAHYDADEAVSGACLESLTVWHISRFLGLHKRVIPKGTLRSADRMAYWGKSEHVSQLAWFWQGDIISLPKAHPYRDSRALSKQMAALGCSAVALPMSPPFLQKRGLHATIVSSPELQPLNLDSHPEYRGGARLSKIPKLFGIVPAKHPPTYPHPFP